MAKIENLFGKLIGLEFNSPANALHWNAGEKGWTFMGIYEYAHPKWSGWSKIKEVIEREGKAKGSVTLYYDIVLTKMVEDFYKHKFWNKMRLDEILHQHIADEMMVCAVNAGIGTAVKFAQKLAGVTVDGVIGSKSIAALNTVNPVWFDVEYDKLEIAHYEMLAANNPNFVKFINGWRNRTVAV